MLSSSFPLFIVAMVILIRVESFSSKSCIRTLDQQKSKTFVVRKECVCAAVAPLAPNGESETTVSGSVPFIVEPLSEQTNDATFKEISDMCITAFFDDDSKDELENMVLKPTTPWKLWQLAYLRSLQEGDLKQRRGRKTVPNIMFVARQVVPASDSSYKTQPLLLDLSEVHNFSGEEKQQNQDFVRGPVLGFVEVTQRHFGIGKIEEDSDDEREDEFAQNIFSNKSFKKAVSPEKRPILTNLSVRSTVRRSGVGSKLVEACEQAVLREWKKSEIILEVEDDNKLAQEFYKNRGYKLLFEDPSSRRYDLSGLWLKEVRCKHQVYRKAIKGGIPIIDNFIGGNELLRQLRENLFETSISN